MPGTDCLLIVEDSPEDFDIIVRALRRCGFVGEILHCEDGDEAMDMLHALGGPSQPDRGELPRLVILDLNLPGTDGRGVLESIKSDPVLKTTPVVIFTTSNDPGDIETCYQLGASSYLKKPIDADEFQATIEIMRHYWFDVVVTPNVVTRQGL